MENIEMTAVKEWFNDKNSDLPLINSQTDILNRLQLIQNSYQVANPNAPLNIRGELADAQSCFGVRFSAEDVICVGAPGEVPCKDYAVCKDVATLLEEAYNTLPNCVTEVPEESQPVYEPTVSSPIPPEDNYIIDTTQMFTEYTDFFPSLRSVSISDKIVKIYLGDIEIATINGNGLRFKCTGLEPSSIGLTDTMWCYKHRQVTVSSEGITKEHLQQVIYAYLQLVYYTDGTGVSLPEDVESTVLKDTEVESITGPHPPDYCYPAELTTAPLSEDVVVESLQQIFRGQPNLVSVERDGRSLIISTRVSL
jgi:hypothetical protein